MSLTINHQTNDISATSGSVTIDGAALGGGISYGENYTELLSSSISFNSAVQNITGNGAGNYLVWARSYYTSYNQPYLGFEGINSSTVEAVKQLIVDQNGNISLRAKNDVTWANNGSTFSLPTYNQPYAFFELNVSGNGEFKMIRTSGSGQITVAQIWKVT